jgi:hypothetical protein
MSSLGRQCFDKLARAAELWNFARKSSIEQNVKCYLMTALKSLKFATNWCHFFKLDLSLASKFIKKSKKRR